MSLNRKTPNCPFLFYFVMKSMVRTAAYNFIVQNLWKRQRQKDNLRIFVGVHGRISDKHAARLSFKYEIITNKQEQHKRKILSKG